MRKKIVAGVALAVLLGFSTNGANAGGIIDENTRDFSKFTCSDLLEDVADDIKKGKSAEEAAGMNMMMVAMWIDGYLSHETGDTKTTLDGIGNMISAVGKTCDKRSKQKVLDIVKRALGH
ncbi:MAG: HdeA/HdeB family chaperone [Rhodospirillaceae bacterium]